MPELWGFNRIRMIDHPPTFDAAHYAMAAAIVAMAAAWWKHVQSVAAQRDREIEQRVETAALLDKLADEMTETRRATLKLVERLPMFGESTERELRMDDPPEPG